MHPTAYRKKTNANSWMYIQELAVTAFRLTHELIGRVSANAAVVPRLLRVKFTSDLRDKLLSLWPQRILQLCSLQFRTECQLRLFMMNNFTILHYTTGYATAKTLKNLCIKTRDPTKIFPRSLTSENWRHQNITRVPRQAVLCITVCT